MSGGLSGLGKPPRRTPCGYSHCLRASIGTPGPQDSGGHQEEPGPSAICLSPAPHLSLQTLARSPGARPCRSACQPQPGRTRRQRLGRE